MMTMMITAHETCPVTANIVLCRWGANSAPDPLAEIEGPRRSRRREKGYGQEGERKERDRRSVFSISTWGEGVNQGRRY